MVVLFGRRSLTRGSYTCIAGGLRLEVEPYGGPIWQVVSNWR